MNISCHDGIQINATPVNKGRNAFVNIHEIVGGYGIHLYFINEQTFVVKEKGKYPKYHILIMPEKGTWLKDWLEEFKDYYELVGPIGEVINGTTDN